MYKLIALIGEAGSGKDTLMQNILKKRSFDFNEIISCTTRPMREGEAEGVNYYYMTPEAFIGKVKNNEMLESTCFNNWYYGTSIDSLRDGSYNIGVFNPDGIRSIRNNPRIDLTVFRIECLPKIRLLRQLNREENPDVNEIIRRWTTDQNDFKDLDFYYIAIENNDEEDLDLATYAILQELNLV